MTMLDIVILALNNLGGQGKYADIYNECEKIYGGILSYGQKAGIRKIIENHSSDSKSYKGQQDIFYSVNGIGEGVWGLR